VDYTCNGVANQSSRLPLHNGPLALTGSPCIAESVGAFVMLLSRTIQKGTHSSLWVYCDGCTPL